MTASRHRVVACVIRRNGRLLVCQRPPDKRHGGLWEFPGGKVEATESDETAVVRELREELGVEATRVGAPLFEVPDPGSNFLIAFVPVEIEGDPICHEHSAMTWATSDELSELSLAPSDRSFLVFLRNWNQTSAHGKRPR
jgi:mutator protein MutT